MFWQTGKNTTVEPFNKHKFVAIFTNFEKSDVSPLNSYSFTEPKRFEMAVKSIDLPKINLNFERAYANHYVHYFQKGEIYWEPINITFIDAATRNNSEFLSVKDFFMNFVNGINFDIDDSFASNQTSVIDHPVLCEEIEIRRFNRIANSDYPIPSDGKLVQANREPNDNIGSIEQELVNKSTLFEGNFLIKRPRLTRVDFGTMDYNSDEINQISITIVPEWCYNVIK